VPEDRHQTGSVSSLPRVRDGIDDVAKWTEHEPCRVTN
jgi:hypothetical protein